MLKWKAIRRRRKKKKKKIYTHPVILRPVN
jgi:hypothetical protein